jgi:predicted porin
MNKKLLTLAVGAALVGAFSAAQADVKINGYINGSLDYIKGKTSASTTDNKSKLNVSSNASNVVINADEDLGGGLHGVFSWQEFVRMDDNNGAGNTTAMTGGNTWVGLKSDAAGTVLLGNNDSGAKLNGRAFDLFGNQIGDSRNLDVNSNRLNNLVAYQSPNLAGFSLLLAHSTNTDSVTNTAPVGGGTVTTTFPAANSTSTRANSAQLKYTLGTLLVGVGYDKLLVSGADGDKWLNAGVKYGLPSGTDLIAFYQKHNNIGGGTSDGKTWGLGVAQKIGASNTVKAQYYQFKVDNVDCKPKMLAVGFDHAFSKTYTGYAAYAQAKNETKAGCTTVASMAGGGHGDNPGTIAGENMSGFSVGAIMKF